MCEIGQRQKDSTLYGNTKAGDGILIDVLKSLIDNVKKYKPSIFINATEPLLYRDLVNFIEYILQNGLKCSVTTNGTLLEKFAYKLVEIGLPELWVSIDGPPKIHNEVRGVPNTFEKAYKGIKMVIERKRQLKVGTPIVGVSYAISNYNYEYLEETAQIFEAVGIDRMVFGHLNFIDSDMARMHNRDYAQIFGKVRPSNIVVNPKEVDVGILTKQITHLKRKYTDSDFTLYFLPDIETKDELETYYYDSSKFICGTKCKIAWRSVHILSDGEVIPAFRCFHLVMGNISKEPFTKIWNNKRYRKFRKRIKKVGATPACTRCCAILGERS
jgi:radical SAM protein with 4Fe4S-binding SPASM domain